MTQAVITALISGIPDGANLLRRNPEVAINKTRLGIYPGGGSIGAGRIPSGDIKTV